MEISQEMMSVFMPAGILEYFDFINSRVVDNVIMIRLQEKDWVPEVPKKQRGKKITSKGFRDFPVEDFPVRGKKVLLQIRRRVWKIEGVTDLLKRDIPITFPNTKLQKEFAVFLKGGDRKNSR